MANYRIETKYRRTSQKKTFHIDVVAREEGAEAGPPAFSKVDVVGPKGPDPDKRAEEMGDELADELEAAGHTVTARIDHGKVID